MLWLLQPPIKTHGFPRALKSLNQEKGSGGGLYTEIIIICSVSEYKSSKFPTEISLFSIIEDLSLAKIALPWMGWGLICFCIIKVISEIDRHCLR